MQASKTRENKSIDDEGDDEGDDDDDEKFIVSWCMGQNLSGFQR